MNIWSELLDLAKSAIDDLKQGRDPSAEIAEMEEKVKKVEES